MAELATVIDRAHAAGTDKVGLITAKIEANGKGGLAFLRDRLQRTRVASTARERTLYTESSHQGRTVLFDHRGSSPNSAIILGMLSGGLAPPVPQRDQG